MPAVPPPNATITTYRNPVLPGWNAHPSVCNVPGKGYFVATSSAAFLPAVPVYHSTDLFTWELVGHAIHDAPSYASNSSNGKLGEGEYWDADVSGGEDGSNSSKTSLYSEASSSASGTRESAEVESAESSESGEASGSSEGESTTNSRQLRASSSNTRAPGLWTPSLSYFGGRWYAIIVHETPSGPRLLLTTTRDIFDTNAWTAPVPLGVHGRDPHLFWDAGRSYLVYSKDEGAEGEQGASPPLYILPFDVGAHAPTGPATLLWAGVHRGARLLRCLGWYYLLVDGTAESDGKMDKGASFAGEHACTRVYRSKTAPHAGGFLDGNFESSPVPVLNNGAHADVRGTSRLNLVRGERGWTAIFHAVRRAPEQSESEAGSSFTPSPFGPETYMANAAWVDAWPVINGGEHVGLTPDAEGMRWLPEVDEFEDEFIGEMSYAWSSTNARTSTVDSLAISSLDADADAELVLRQPSASLDFEADLVSGSSTAGVVVRVGTRYAKVGVRGTEMVHDVHGKISTSLLDTSSPAQVTLFIKARAGGYDLGVRGSAVVLHATFPPPSGNGEHGAVLGLYTSAEARFLRAGWKAVDEA